MILRSFESLKRTGKKAGLNADSVLSAHRDLFATCLQFLSSATPDALTSKIAGKGYFSLAQGTRLSRAINRALYEPQSPTIDSFFKAVESNDFSTLSSEQITQAAYTVAMAFCASIDLIKDGDQKTPGTFFEYFIGHLFARRLGINPDTRVVINHVELPTDFVFSPGEDKAKLHLPVKTSTRERVIQVWAHQRLLDGVAGLGAYKGILVCLSETKTEKKKREVTEICLPDQWRLYQQYIASMTRVYYLDLPPAYAQLDSGYPRVSVKPFGAFYGEIDQLLQR